MAESSIASTYHQKKPSRYVRSKIPILSKEYISTLKNVKSKKVSIEKKEAEIKVLMKDKAELCSHMEAMSLNFSSKDKGFVKDVSAASSTPYTKSDIRSVIRTPGETKRLVKG